VALVRIELEVRPGTEAPPRNVSGWFLAWPQHSDRPLVLWRGPSSTDWRAGCVVQRVDAWAGPLPDRGKR